VQSLRTIRKRIKSVGSTQKITKAMKMVAAAQFRRSQEAAVQARPYAAAIDELVRGLSGAGMTHPLMAVRPVKTRLLVVLSSDRGLCAAFNGNVLREADLEMKRGIPTLLLSAGKRGSAYLNRRYRNQLQVEAGFWTEFQYGKAAALAARLTESFLAGTYDRVDVLYSEFKSVIYQKPVVATLLPIEPPAAGAASADYIYEPSREEILEKLIPRAVTVKFYNACMNSLAGEHGARMTAMDSASRNAEEMIDDLTLKLNRARQATITKELMEIIGGAEALK